MKKLRINRRCLSVAMLAILALPEVVNAQYFSTSGYGDLLLGFRKTTGTPAYELVVNIGNVTNLFAVPPGSSIPIPGFSTALSDSFSDYNNLQWSVSATFGGFSSWNGYAVGTIWYTQPRFDSGVQSVPLDRLSKGVQTLIGQSIKSIASGASLISAQLIGGTTNADNNSRLVREPSDSSINNNNDYAYFIKDPQNPAVGDFAGYLPSNAENTTPASFTSPAVSVVDFYQSVPTTYADPTTGATSGAAYYIGYFTLDSAGSLTFTRASAPQPPAPRIVSVTRLDTTTTVYFATTNGPTYTLYYTNSAGLSSPTASWPSSPTTIVGNGQTNSLSDTTTDAIRFYRVGLR